MNYEVYVEYLMAWNGHRMAIRRRDPHTGARMFAQPLVFKEFPPNEVPPDDQLFALRDDRMGAEDGVRQFLQAMVDAADELGIVPTRSKDRTDELKSVRYHLEDMRKLVFEKAVQP